MQRYMQDDWPLVVTQIIDYAAKYHGNQEIVTRSVEGPTIFSTYHEVRDRSALCALALRRLGVQPGDRVATLAWNTARHLECWYGIAGVAAVCHTLNPRLFDQDLEYIINHAEDSILFADITFAAALARLAPNIPTVRAVIFLTDRAHMPDETLLGGKAQRSLRVLCYEELLQQERPGLAGFQWTPCAETDPCGLCYTSGTTGKPKGVVYSHRSNFLHALAGVFPDALNLKSTSSFLLVVPMFHANSWGVAFSGPMVGARLVLPGPALDGASIYDLLDTHAVTLTAGVPTVWLALLEYMETALAKEGKVLALKTLERMVVGGSACPRLLLEYFGMHGVDVLQLWGMTETSPMGTVGTLTGLLSRRIGSDAEAQTQLKLKQGRPHIFVDMRILGDDGQELLRDGKAFGDLQVRGPHVLRRYYRAERDAVDAEGWFDTGDVATLDSDGFMQITDRSKDVIKSGGEWISSIEIENIAVGHRHIAEAAVIGVPHAKWGERPLLVVVPKAEAKGKVDAAEVLQFLEGKIAKWWMPDEVVFVSELPHTATGKLSKLLLRDQHKKGKLAKL